MVGLNGCGKSTLLTAIGCRELPIPEHMDIYHLTREIEASDMSALEAVISCDEERVRLEQEAEALASQVCTLHILNFPLMSMLELAFLTSSFVIGGWWRGETGTYI